MLRSDWCKKSLVFGVMILLFGVNANSAVSGWLVKADKDSDKGDFTKRKVYCPWDVRKNFRKISLGNTGRDYVNAHDDHLLLQSSHFFRMRDRLDNIHLKRFQRIPLQTLNPFPLKKSSYSTRESGSLGDRTIYVPDDYSTIQEAVDYVEPGDTIIVRDGTYVENVVIDKPYLTIRSESGPENCIVKAKSHYDPVFLIYDNYTALIGFTIMDGRDGIELWYSSNNNITNNNISNNNDDGIELWYSSNNNITNNNISNNEEVGIYLHDSSNNNITNNNISNNEEVGIYLHDSSNNEIADNSFIGDGVVICESYQNIIEGNTVNGKPLVYLEGKTDVKIEDAGQVILVKCSDIEVKNLNLSNTDVGIELWNSGNCRIESNVISNNNIDGIELWDSSNNIITNNSISNNDGNGIELDASSNNIIANNSISNNEWDGIEFHASSNNIIANNSISNNDYGIELGVSSNNNIIYLNSFVNNTEYNAWDWERNHWDNGTIGNYWDDYFGSDLNGDGIGDIPYPIPPYYKLNFDRYPIVKEETPPDTNPPEMSIDKPRKGYLYLSNQEKRPTPGGNTIIIGGVDIEVVVRDKESGVYNVTFYIDNKKKVEYYGSQLKYSWRWDETVFGKHTIKVVARDRVYNANSTELTVFIVNINLPPW